MIDDIDSFILRPYLDCKAWAEDDRELSFCFHSSYLIGRTPYILDIHLPDRVSRQFNEVQ